MAAKRPFFNGFEPDGGSRPARNAENYFFLFKRKNSFFSGADAMSGPEKKEARGWPAASLLARSEAPSLSRREAPPRRKTRRRSDDEVGARPSSFDESSQRTERSEGCCELSFYNKLLC